jgi:hypothetical protein
MAGRPVAAGGAYIAVFAMCASNNKALAVREAEHAAREKFSMRFLANPPQKFLQKHSPQVSAHMA